MSGKRWWAGLMVVLAMGMLVTFGGTRSWAADDETTSSDTSVSKDSDSAKDDSSTGGDTQKDESKDDTSHDDKDQ